jgi:8-oxo-dGTP diphosphatase
LETNAKIVRRGVVAVILRDERFLIIRRSENVAAPGRLCFPGGGIEAGESEAAALRRELCEELSIQDAEPTVRLFEMVTPFGIHLAWWQTHVADLSSLCPNPIEVADILWMTPQELRDRPDGLVSNGAFLDALHRGEIALRLGKP